MALVLGVTAFSSLNTYTVNNGNRPSDEELTANFSSREKIFDALVRMLATDRRALSAEGGTAVDLETMARAGTNAVRVRMYRDLLQQISVADFRYFPDSGTLILVPDGQENLERPSKYYLYLPHARAQPLVEYHGYNWRVPGVYVLTGDRPLKGLWFIHHETTMEGAVTSY